MPPFSEACERNKDPILEILKFAFNNNKNVLEIGSGTGQHAVYFAENLPHLIWQTSDLNEKLPGITERINSQGPENVKLPIELNVCNHPWPIELVDAIFSANTLHIMPSENVVHFFNRVGEVLSDQGVLCIYGPFKYKGEYTSESNMKFDQWLKNRDPKSGIRDFETINKLAEEQCLTLLRDHKMPANNQCIVWRK